MFLQVYIERTGLIDRQALEEQVSVEDMELHFARVLERAYAMQWQVRLHL